MTDYGDLHDVPVATLLTEDDRRARAERPRRGKFKPGHPYHPPKTPEARARQLAGLAYKRAREAGSDRD